MPNQQILKKSLTITTSQTGLWALGIFLSSGFNLHWWYFLSWLKQTGIIDQLVDSFNDRHITITAQAFMVLGLVALFIFCLVVFNMIKLWFFGMVHQNLHSQDQPKCFLCKRIFSDQQSLLKLIQRKVIVWRTCLASLITIGSTVVTLTAFRFLLDQANIFSGQSIILAICLAFILVGISLWNMLVVLFIFWYELSFVKAAILAFDMLLTKMSKILGMTLLLTIIFLLAVSAGSVVIWRLPMLFSILPSNISAGFISEHNFVHAAHTIISGLAWLLFLAWLVINNIFFNVAMLILFDQLIGGVSIKDALAQAVSMPAKPAILHHSKLPVEPVNSQ